MLVELSLHHSDNAEARDFMITRLSRDPSRTLRRVLLVLLLLLLQRLVHIGQNDTALLRVLQRSAIENRNEQCRAAALESLSRQLKHNGDVRSFVETRPVTGPNNNVRAAARNCLAHYWPTQPTPDTLVAALRRRVLEDASHACFDHACEQLQHLPHRVVRLTAAHSLSTCWANDPRTVPALTAQAGKEEDADGRAYIESAITTAVAYVPVSEHLF
ncbi:hypothetical protein ACFRR7_32945 [Streptomyces sp. NPDC056909]|uniref:hypothetical protein n=1 Tax=Streptomyces sp. NPDC056909 TaxID=3345963 RepID=UPI0036CCA5B8